MEFFTYLAYMILATIVLEALRPKNQIDQPDPTAAGDVQVPTSEQGRVVPIVFGTCKITGINTIDAYDLQIWPVYKNVKTGLFSDEDIFQYEEFYLSLSMGICRGFNAEDIEGGSKVLDIQLEDKSLIKDAEPGEEPPAWINGIKVEAETKVPKIVEETYDYTKYYINKKELFGSDTNGGVLGTIKVFKGTDTQEPDPDYAAATGNYSGHRGLVYAIFGAKFPFLWGHSKFLATPAVFVKRVRRVWAWEAIQSMPGIYWDIDGGLNPAIVLYEIFTRYTPKPLPLEKIDMQSFIDAALILKEEGIGYNGLLDSPTGVDTLKNQIEKLIDGVADFDETTGRMQLRLNRAGYNPADLIVLNADNITDVVSYQKTAPQETLNQVKLTYTDTEGNTFQDKTVTVEDTANVIGTGSLRPTELSYKCLGTSLAATKIAKRALNNASQQIIKVSVKTNNPLANNLKTGSPFYLELPEYEIPKIPFRVAKLQKATLLDNTATIEAIQDIFGEIQNATVIGGINDFKGYPELTDFFVCEVPPEFTSTAGTVALLAARQNKVTTGYFDDDSGKHTQSFVMVEKLKTSVSKWLEDDLVLTFESTDRGLINADESAKAAKKAVAIIDPSALNPEWVAFSGYTIDADNNKITLTGLERARFGTIARSYDANTKVAIFLTNTIPTTIAENSQTIYCIPEGPGGTGAKVPAIAKIDGDLLKPYLPDNFKVNGDAHDTTLTDSLTITFTARDRAACTASATLITKTSPAQATTAQTKVRIINTATSANTAWITCTNGQTINKSDFLSTIGITDPGLYPIKIEYKQVAGANESEVISLDFNYNNVV